MSAANTKIRDQVASIRKALAAKRDERATAIAARDEAKERFVASGLDAAEATESAEFKAAQEAVGRVGEIDDAISDLQATERGLLELLGGSDDPGAPASAGSAIEIAGHGLDVRGLLRGEAYQRFLASGAPTSRSKFGSFLLGQVADADGTARMLGGPFMAEVTPIGSEEKQGAIPADRRGIIVPNLRPLRLLDLFPMGTTDSNVVEYVQVLTKPEQAAETAAGDLKPEAAFTTKDEQAPARTIAVWIKIKRQALSDVGMLEAVIRSLLTHDVRRRLEDQMAAGDGEDENIKGILETSGIGTPEAVDGDNTADAILRAVTAVYLSDGDPNFVALHPLTWQDLLLMREDQAQRTGAYLYGTPAMQVAPTIWGLNIVNTRAVPAESPLVGDSMAATPLVREGLSVRVSDSDTDDFVRNRVTVLVEVRVAFPIWRPSSFAIGPLDGGEVSAS